MSENFYALRMTDWRVYNIGIPNIIILNSRFIFPEKYICLDLLHYREDILPYHAGQVNWYTFLFPISQFSVVFPSPNSSLNHYLRYSGVIIAYHLEYFSSLIIFYTEPNHVNYKEDKILNMAFAVLRDI